MVRKKQAPSKTKRRVALTTLSPTVRRQFAPGFGGDGLPLNSDLPSKKTWDVMMNKLEKTYNKPETQDVWAEPTAAQWDVIEKADRRYKRPKTKKRKTKVSGAALLAGAIETANKRKKTTKKRKVTKKATKKPKKEGKVCLSLMEIAKAFPDIATKVCFHPKVASFKSLMSKPSSSKRKAATFL